MQNLVDCHLAFLPVPHIFTCSLQSPVHCHALSFSFTSFPGLSKIPWLCVCVCVCASAHVRCRVGGNTVPGTNARKWQRNRTECIWAVTSTMIPFSTRPNFQGQLWESWWEMGRSTYGHFWLQWCHVTMKLKFKAWKSLFQFPWLFQVSMPCNNCQRGGGGGASERDFPLQPSASMVVVHHTHNTTHYTKTTVTCGSLYMFYSTTQHSTCMGGHMYPRDGVSSELKLLHKTATTLILLHEAVLKDSCWPNLNS